MDKIPMTPSGYEALEKEIRHRIAVERPRIIVMIKEARAHGDLSENAEYHAAKEMQSLNEARISFLEAQLSRAEVIDIKKLSGDTVVFGATVELEDCESGLRKTYQIVGDLEADVKRGLLSISSPIVRALIGKRIGDLVEVTTPNGPREYEICNLSF